MTLSIDWLREVLTVPVLTMARLAACLVVAPFFSNQFITGTVRNGIILSLTLVVYPMVSPAFAAQVPSLPQAAIILVKEVFLGIVIGFLSGAPFWIASSVGFIVDTQRGTGMGEIFDPNLGTQTSPLGAMLSEVIVTLFYVSGGLFLFLGMMFEGYRLMPIESFFPRFIPYFPEFFLAFADQLMRLIAILAAPMVICMFLVDFSLGLVNRFAPSLNVFFLSMPIKSALSLLVLVLYTATFVMFLGEDFIGMEQLRKLFFVIN